MKKLTYNYRPKRIRIEYRCSFTEAIIHYIDWPYEPVKMLDGWYRRLINKLKPILTAEYKKDLLAGRIVTKITLPK